MQEYAKFVAMIRENRKTMKPEKAVTKAVDDCIEQGILRDFLMKNKARAIKTSIYEYDAKRQRKFDKEEGREEERANTERERERAEKAEEALRAANERIAKLEAEIAGGNRS